MLNTLLETTPTEETVSEQTTTFLDSMWSSIGSWCVNTGIKILVSIVILLVTFRVITVIARKIQKKGDSEKYDKTVMRTIAYVFNIGMKLLVAICLVGYLGINTSGLTALVTSLGVCFGLAVNGALSNLAGGILLLVTRPFRVDDFIEAQGVSGTVEDIHMVNTKIRTPDNKVIYLPNGALSTGNIINYSEKPFRRVDFVFSIGYTADYDKAREIIMNILTSHELTLDDPAPYVRMGAHSASSIDINARAWAKNADYWTVYPDIIEKVKAEFDKNGIEIPFNQLDVHVKND